MTELELMDILQEQGWTISRIESDNKQIFRAGRFRDGHGQTRYIGTANTLKKRSKEDVLKALARETRPIQRRKGAGRKAASSVTEVCLLTVQRRQSGQGMQDIDLTPPFEERSRVYFKLARSK
jgi:hypothetical protein